MARERFVGAAPVLKERKAAPTAILEEKINPHQWEHIKGRQLIPIGEINPHQWEHIKGCQLSPIGEINPHQWEHIMHRQLSPIGEINPPQWEHIKHRKLIPIGEINPPQWEHIKHRKLIPIGEIMAKIDKIFSLGFPRRLHLFRPLCSCNPHRRRKCVNIRNVLSRTSPPAIDPKPSQAANTVQEVDKPGLHRQRCVVHGCKELIAPSMWKNHLNLHTQSILPGSVPEDWLGQNNMVICSYCFHLVASSQVFYLQHSIQFYTKTVRRLNWLKFFMLPKCVLVAPKRRGRHHKPLPINHLCDLWSKGQFGFLWEHASQQVTSRTRQAHTSGSDHNIRLAIGLVKEGLYGKACQILTSSGVAPNNDTTWQLLQAKHPKGPPPVCPPNDTSNFPSILPNTFDILSVLRSFTKSTACGPSGLRVQHLLDATEVPMQSSICSSLRSIVNLLATGSVSNVVSKFLAGGNLTALTKDKPGSPPDIRPIAGGETLRRLVGKCLCQITIGKASDYFSPHQFGVACPSGAEKIVHEMKKCNAFNFEILGALIGDTIFCAKFIAEKRAGASKFLALLKEVGSLDSQLALCFSDCLSIDLPNTAWQQAQLCLSRGGLGLRSLSQPSAAAYVASSAVLVSPADVTSTDELLTSPKNQKEPSSRIEHSQFQALFESSSLPNRARLLSVASPHAASWLSVVPSPGLNLHLESAEFQTAIKWWLGIDLFSGEKCPCCLALSLDPLGHHALTCRHNGDVVSRHNRVRDVFFESCRQAGIGGQMEVGSGLGHDGRRTRPADVLVPNWVLGKPAAFDITVTLSLTPITLHEASVTSGSTAQVAENRKHASNDAKCSELGWVCVPLAVEAYGCWGPEAQTNLSRLAARLAIRSNCCKSQATLALYGRLNLVLVRANARALLSRSMATGC
eukprot:Em0003g690a